MRRRIKKILKDNHDIMVALAEDEARAMAKEFCRENEETMRVLAEK